MQRVNGGEVTTLVACVKPSRRTTISARALPAEFSAVASRHPRRRAGWRVEAGGPAHRRAPTLQSVVESRRIKQPDNAETKRNAATRASPMCGGTTLH